MELPYERAKREADAKAHAVKMLIRARASLDAARYALIAFDPNDEPGRIAELAEASSALFDVLGDLHGEVADAECVVETERRMT